MLLITSSCGKMTGLVAFYETSEKLTEVSLNMDTDFDSQKPYIYTRPVFLDAKSLLSFKNTLFTRPC